MCTRLEYLYQTMRGELDSVVGDELMNVAVLVSFRLCMANQDYHLNFVSNVTRSPGHDMGIRGASPCLLELRGSRL